MKVFIDADILVFRCGFAAERNVWFLSVSGGDPVQYSYKKEAMAELDKQLPNLRTREEGKDYQIWSERYLEPLENALHLLRSSVNSIMSAVECNEWDITMVLSGKTNYRHDIATTKPYKGNRDPKNRPTHEHAIRDYIISSYEHKITEGEEADDALGILQCSTEGSCIVSIDKDLLQIPGLHYNFVTKEYSNISEDEGMAKFYSQLLTGDTVDNIPGLHRVGIGKANKLLEGLSVAEMWDVVVTEYAARGPEDWQKYLKEQGQLLWIRREEGQMWEPQELPSWESQEINMYAD